jgi:hypothetical protein
MRKQGREGSPNGIFVIDPLNTTGHDTSISPTDHLPLRIELQPKESLLGEVASIVPYGLLSHGLDVFADNHVPV